MHDLFRVFRVFALGFFFFAGAGVGFASAASLEDSSVHHEHPHTDHIPSPPHNHDNHGMRAELTAGPAVPDVEITDARPIVLLVIYSVLIVLASLAGGWLPQLINLSHTRMQLIVSLVAGLMLGIALFHLLPHAIVELGGRSVDRAMWWMVVGLLTMFFLNRAFHFHLHQHDVVETAPWMEHSGHHHGHTPANSPPQADSPPADPRHAYDHPRWHRFSWIGVAFGLALHTLIDGMAVAASVQTEAAHGADWSLFGLGTFLAVLLHKPLDAVPITSLMATGGWSIYWRHTVNIGFALMCPLGAALFYLGVTQYSMHSHLVIGCALAFSAGVFLCISLGDLLPELEFHAHDRIKLSAALLLGVALAWGIGFLEPEHAHDHHPGAAQHEIQQGAHEHAH